MLTSLSLSHPTSTSRVSSLITASPLPLPPHVFVRSHILSPQTRHFAKRTPVRHPDSRKILLVALPLQVSPSHRQRNSPTKSRKHFLPRPYAVVYESVFNAFVFALDIVYQCTARTFKHALRNSARIPTTWPFYTIWIERRIPCSVMR